MAGAEIDGWQPQAWTTAQRSSSLGMVALSVDAVEKFVGHVRIEVL